MYLLEHRVLSGVAPHARHSWVIYAFCGKVNLLKEICAAQSDKRNWRVTPSYGTCEDILLRRGEAPAYRKAG